MKNSTIKPGSKVKIHANPISCNCLETEVTVNEVLFSKDNLSYCTVTDEYGRVYNCFVNNNS